MRKRILAVAIAAATMAGGAQAAGFYLKEQSVVGQGRAFAGSAAGTDGASAAYFNPAGIVGLERQVEVGVHVISPDVTVTNDGSTNALAATKNQLEPYSAKPVPNAHLVLPIDSETAFSLAVGAPYGFSNDYGADSFTRADNTKVDLSVIELTSSLAKKFSDTSSISFSLIYQTRDVEQTIETVFGSTTQAAQGNEIAFGIGYQTSLSDRTTLGASYKSQSTIGISGTLNGGAYDNAGMSADFDLPSIFAIGVAHAISDSTKVYADVTHYGWSAYEKLTALSDGSGQLLSSPITPGTPLDSATNNYKDTISWSLGIDHDYGNGLVVRSGVHIDPTPTNDTDRSTSTPDSDRTWLSAGLSKEITEQMVFDAAVTHILADDGKINKSLSASKGGGFVKAKVDSSVNILSLGLRYKF